MGLRSAATYWSKAENNSGLTSPEIGPAGTINGTLNYAAAKFNNGFISTVNTDYVRYNNSNLVPNYNRFIFECWVKMTVSDTTWDTNNYEEFICGNRQFAAAHGISLMFNPDKHIGVWVKDGSGDTELINYIPAWSANDLIHLMLVVDNLASFDGSKTIALYWNGIQVNSSTTSFNITTPLSHFYIGNGWAALPRANQHFYIDNPKMYGPEGLGLITDILNNRINEGFPSEAPPVSCDIVLPEVLILGREIDIYSLGHVDKIINVLTKKTFRKDKFIINQIKQTVKNYDNFYSVNNEKSIFKDIKWRFQPFKIKINNDIIWDGVIREIIRDHNKKIATIISTDELYQFSKIRISYNSSTWEPPAEAFKNICDDIGFTKYNQALYIKSKDQQEAAGIYIKVKFDKEDDITFQQAAEKLADIGAADIYTFKNEIYYVYVSGDAFSGNIKITINEDDIIKLPTIQSDERNIVNDYNIKYYDGLDVALTDATGDNIGAASRLKFGTQPLAEFDGSAGQQIEIRDQAAALAIGNAYIKRTHKNLNTDPSALEFMSFELSIDFENFMELISNFNFNLSDESWTDKIFNTFELNINYDRRNIKVLAYEVNTGV